MMTKMERVFGMLNEATQQAFALRRLTVIRGLTKEQERVSFLDELTKDVKLGTPPVDRLTLIEKRITEAQAELRSVFLDWDMAKTRVDTASENMQRMRKESQEIIRCLLMNVSPNVRADFVKRAEEWLAIK